MGLGATKLLTKHEEDWEDRERVLNPHALDELDFFMEWNLADITYAQRRWEEHERKEKEARSAALSPKRRGTASSDRSAAGTSVKPPTATTKTRWEQFYLVSYEVKERHQQQSDEVERRAWHPACHGFVMRKDECAEEQMAEYHLGDTFRPKTGSDRHPYHTDDEMSEAGDDDVVVKGDAEDEPGVAPITAWDEEIQDGGERKRGRTPQQQQQQQGESTSPPGGGGASPVGALPADADNPNEPPTTQPAAQAGDTDPSVPAAPPPAADEPLRPPPRPRSPALEVIHRPLPEAFNPAKRSPVYFGYLSTTVEVEVQEKASAKGKVETVEHEALDRMRLKRQKKVTEMTREATEAKEARERRMENVKEKHRKKLEEREKERKEAEKFFKPDEYQSFLSTYQSDEQALLAANQAELVRMKKTSDEKWVSDEAVIKHLDEHVKAYEDLQSLRRPQGPKLVETTREELVQICQRLQDRMHVLEEVQRDLALLNEEMKTADDATLAQGRSLRITLESRLEAERRKVEAVMQEMDDAEVILRRAVARKAKEEKILPLFNMLKAPDEDGEYLDVRETIVGLVVLSRLESFSEKMRFLLHLFDFNGNNFLDTYELTELLDVVFRFMEHSGYMRVHIDREEAESMVLRVFFMEKIDAVQGMTTYEAKEWIRTLASRSRQIAALLSCSWENSELSTYERQCMEPVHQLEKGMLTATDLKYHLSQSMLTYRPLLASDAKLIMHERALARGADDPLKPDYSRFVPKKARKTLSNVVPLTHGHLGSLEDWRRSEMRRAATMLQAVVRGVAGRKRTEMIARVAAFTKARDQALQRVRDKVRSEVLGKEALKGMEKLKYDAKIRNRAAKMKVQGLPCEREDVIAAIIKEGIEAGEKEVHLRFHEIAKDKGLDTYMDAEDVGIKHVQDDAKKQLVNVKTSVAEVSEQGAKAADLVEKKVETAADQEAERPDSYINLPDIEECLDEKTMALRRDALLMGRRPLELFTTGETPAEQFLRFKLMAPEYSRDELYDRLRSLEDVLTQMKVEEMLLELPSKRLLLQLVDHTGRAVLCDELREHFRLVRNADVVARILRDVMTSDFERGYLLEQARGIYGDMHVILEKGWREQVMRGLKKAVDVMNQASRSAALAVMSKEDQVRVLKERELIYVRKKEEVLVQSLVNHEKVNRKLASTRNALTELGRRLKNLDRYLDYQIRGEPICEDVPIELRCNWYKRYATAIRWPEDTVDALRAKYTELANVSNDFLYTARRAVAVIVNELYLPVDRKTIRPVAEKSCDGRGKEGGRGPEGMRYKYEVWNIRFKVLVDDHGIFNGSDEYAAKAGGAERRNSMEVLKLYMQGIGIPLVATVDYHGFRVLCVAKMPIELIKYNESGDIRSKREELVFGTRNRGDTFVNSERKVDVLLETVSKRVNLARHSIKAFRDVNSKNIWCSADLRVFRGDDGAFHLLNFWRLMPPEISDVATHLTSAPRGMSMFYRFLRPEFVRSWPEPLSADANLIITRETVDWEKQSQGVREATVAMLDKSVRSLAEYLSKQPVTNPSWQGYGIDVTANLHRYGVNVRHLGLLRSMFWRQLAPKVNVVFNSKRMVTHGDVRLEVERGAQVRVMNVCVRISANPRDEFSEKAATVTEKIRELSGNRVDIWAGEVQDDKNSEQIRLLFLAEMAARATKNVMRSYLRMILKIMCASTEYVQVALIVDFLNVLTGNHARTSEFWSDQLYHAIVLRYGRMAVSFVERSNLRFILAPMALYIIQRLQDMMGFRLTRECLASLHKSPRAFRFAAHDVTTPVVRVKHNIPTLDFAEAMLLTLQADSISSRAYFDHVMEDKPLLYWRFAERRGSKLAFNYGLLGHLANGSYSPAVIFEGSGPIRNEEINRCVRLAAADKARIDTLFLPELAPTSTTQRFSVEVWARVTGNWDLHRVLYMNSRYSLVATRENKWSFLMFDRYVQATVTGATIERDQWAHVVLSYDGTTLRMYINARLVGSIELATELDRKLAEVREERRDAYAKLDANEKSEKEQCWKKTEDACAAFFKRKNGRAHIKQQAMKLIEQADYQRRIAEKNDDVDDGGNGDASKVLKQRSGVQRLTIEAATEEAMAAYRNEVYAKNVKAINESCRQRREELMALHKKQDHEAILRLSTSLRVGGTGPNKATTTGQFFFDGEVCHFAFYSTDLSHDRVHAHYLSGIQERSVESERLYHMASEKFSAAMRLAPDDPMVLKKYAETVCNFVQTDGARQVNERRTKNKVTHALEIFRALENYDAIAELLRRLPNEYEFSDTACQVFKTIVEGRPDYFEGSFFSYRDLALVPNRFMLYESQEPDLIETSALMYKTIMRDPSLALFYGDDDLTFIRTIKSAKLILSIVKQVQTGSDKRMVDVNVYRDCTGLDNDDVRVLADYRRAAVAVSLSGCKLLTDGVMKDVSRYCAQLNALTIDGCVEVTNATMTSLKRNCKDLRLLSAQGCVQITDDGIIALLDGCHDVCVLNLNRCSMLSDAAIAAIANKCKNLELLHIAHCFLITDPGILTFTSGLANPASLTSLDISGCKGLSDDGFEVVGRGCVGLTYLNLSSARITDIGMKAITQGLWKLKTLVARDLYMISDAVFVFDVMGDGRRDADENMLKALTEIDLTDCTRLGDRALGAISTRCQQLSVLKVGGCGNVTDKGVESLLSEPRYGYARGQHLTKVHLSFCIQVTNAAIQRLCEGCEKLNELDLSGCVHLTDDVLLSVAKFCPHLQTLRVSRCKRLTDRALCALADYLWLEELDVSHCNRLTDEGVSVVANELQGLKRLNVAWLYRLTERCLRVIARNCQALQVLNVTECPAIRAGAIDELQQEMPRLKIFRQAKGVEDIGQLDI